MGAYIVSLFEGNADDRHDREYSMRYRPELELVLKDVSMTIVSDHACAFYVVINRLISSRNHEKR